MCTIKKCILLFLIAVLVLMPLSDLSRVRAEDAAEETEDAAEESAAASSEESAQTPAELSGDVSAEPKLIALTFDDGPSGNTERLLDGLKELGVVATFFLNLNADGNEDLLARMVAEGHLLGNHTYSHNTSLGALSPDEITREVEDVEVFLYAAMGGAYQELVRTPGGGYSDRIRETILHPIIYWTVDTRDWESRDESAIYSHIMYDTVDGAIILMHDTVGPTIDAILRAIPVLREQGYEFVTVSELFRRKGNDLIPGEKVYISEGPVILPAYSAPSAEASAYEGILGCIEISGPEVDLAGAGLQYYYTLDGSIPSLASSVYQEPLRLPEGTVLTIMGIDRYGTRTPVTVYTVHVPEYDLVVSKLTLANRFTESNAQEAASGTPKEEAPGYSKGSLRP